MHAEWIGVDGMVTKDGGWGWGWGWDDMKTGMGWDEARAQVKVAEMRISSG